MKFKINKEIKQRMSTTMNSNVTEYFSLPKGVALTAKDVEALWSMRPDKPHKIKIFGKLIDTPRLQQSYGRDYKFSGTVSRGLPIPELLKPLMAYLNKRLGSRFNMLLVNWYRNGNDYIGMHSDDEKQVKTGSSVVTVSFGVTRDFVLKNKTTKERIVIPVKNNSVLIMKPGCQKRTPMAYQRGKRLVTIVSA